MAIELSPLIAQDVETAARRNGLQGILNFFGRPDVFTPMSLREEAQLMASVVNAAPKGERVLWGIDRELFNDRYLISRLQPRVPANARTPFARLKEASRNAYEQNQIMQFSSMSVHEQVRQLRFPSAANTYSATLVTDRLADAFITTLGTVLSPLNVFSKNFGTDTMKPRATVQVRKATAGSTTLTNAINFEQGDSTTVPVSISVSQYSQPFNVSNDELNKGHQLIHVAAKNAQTFGNSINDVWTALLLAANYGAATGIGTLDPATDLPVIYGHAKNFPSKNLVLDGAQIGYLIPQNEFSFKLGQQGAYGFDKIAMCNRFTNAVANCTGFVCDPSAIAVASGLPAELPASEFISLNTVTVDWLGLTVLIVHWFAKASRTHWMSYEVMFGAAPGDLTALRLYTNP